jgi:hypothetical protein
MSALRLRPARRSWLLLLLLFLLTAPAFADSMTIGTLTYVGWGTWGNPSKSMMILQLSTPGPIFDSHMSEMPYSLVFETQVFGWNAGLFQTNPPTYMPIDPPHYCPCEAIVFTMSLLNNYPFRLANGQWFNPNSTITVTLEPLPGQTYLQYGQSVNIVLTSQPTPVPEPTSLLLFGSGLLGIATAAWRRLRGRAALTKRRS